MATYSDPRYYTDPNLRRRAAVARGFNRTMFCRGCRLTTLHAAGSRYWYCVTCLRNQETPHSR